mgnify:CR=1 FL=1
MEMPHFCLLSSPKLGRAVSKVDKNRGECLIFVYLTLQIRLVRPPKSEKCFTAAYKFDPRCPESRTKSSKIEKMFYRRLKIRPALP